MPMLGFHCLLANEACLFRNQQSRTALNGDSWFYLGLVAHSFFWFIGEGLG
jgi:hypothetical protein